MTQSRDEVYFGVRSPHPSRKVVAMDSSSKTFYQIFAGVGFGVIALFGSTGLLFISLAQIKTLDCQRQTFDQGQCQVKTLQGPLEWERNPQTFTLRQFQGAKLESQYSRSNAGRIYRVALKTENETIPLTQSFDSGVAEKNALIDQINGFLADPNQKVLSIQQGDRGFSYLMGGAFIGMSLLVGIPFIGVGLWGLRSST
jgi:hypothetical protein